MDYFSIEGSCLFSILLPLNFAIGEYVTILRQYEKKRMEVVLDVVVVAIGVLVTMELVKRNMDPYISFIFAGGLIVAIVQNALIIHKNNIIEELKEIEMFLQVMKLLLGVGIIIVSQSDWFYMLVLNNCQQEVITICYALYWIWGSETVIFSLINYMILRRKNINEQDNGSSR